MFWKSSGSVRVPSSSVGSPNWAGSGAGWAANSVVIWPLWLTPRMNCAMAGPNPLRWYVSALAWVMVAPGASSVWVAGFVIVVMACLLCCCRDLCGANGILSKDGIDLADGLGEALLHAHGQDLLHGLGAREPALDRHPRPAGLDRL